MQGVIRTVILALALIGLLALCVTYALTGSTRESVGRVSRIGATLSQNVSPFGDSVIFYDGTTLHCVAATGGNEWSYQIGTNADYDANEKRIVAWSGNDLYILNRNGRLIYNNKMSDTVQFASVGDEYVAVFVGDADNGVVSVINGSGQIVDNITVSDQTLLDIGFFMASTTSNAQPIELMWVLGLNTTGTVISTELQTFQPGKLSTGKSSIGEHIAYSIYDENGTLNVVTTRQILHYSYRALEASSPTLIYGYTVEDVKQNGSVLYQLLVPAQEAKRGHQHRQCAPDVRQRGPRDPSAECLYRGQAGHKIGLRFFSKRSLCVQLRRDDLPRLRAADQCDGRAGHDERQPRGGGLGSEIYVIELPT